MEMAAVSRESKDVRVYDALPLLSRLSSEAGLRDLAEGVGDTERVR